MSLPCDTDRPVEFGVSRRRVSAAGSVPLRFVTALRITAGHRVLPRHVTCCALIAFSIRSLPLSNETGGG